MKKKQIEELEEMAKLKAKQIKEMVRLQATIDNNRGLIENLKEEREISLIDKIEKQQKELDSIKEKIEEIIDYLKKE